MYHTDIEVTVEVTLDENGEAVRLQGSEAAAGSHRAWNRVTETWTTATLEQLDAVDEAVSRHADAWAGLAAIRYQFELDVDNGDGGPSGADVLDALCDLLDRVGLPTV